MQLCGHMLTTSENLRSVSMVTAVTVVILHQSKGTKPTRYITVVKLSC